MNFCINCDNLLYYRLQNKDTNNLLFYCRNCGYEEEPKEKNICISKIKNNTTKKHTQFINEYTKFDPTLPRINTIPCVNSDCKFHKTKVNREIIFIRYDEDNMKYVYLCPECNSNWTI